MIPTHSLGCAIKLSAASSSSPLIILHGKKLFSQQNQPRFSVSRLYNSLSRAYIFSVFLHVPWRLFILSELFLRVSLLDSVVFWRRDFNKLLAFRICFECGLFHFGPVDRILQHASRLVWSRPRRMVLLLGKEQQITLFNFLYGGSVQHNFSATVIKFDEL